MSDAKNGVQLGLFQSRNNDRAKDSGDDQGINHSLLIVYILFHFLALSISRSITRFVVNSDDGEDLPPLDFSLLWSRDRVGQSFDHMLRNWMSYSGCCQA
jgi:hypothetical protein